MLWRKVESGDVQLIKYTESCDVQLIKYTESCVRTPSMSM